MVDARERPEWQTRLRASGQRRALFGVLLLVWSAIGVAGAKVALQVLVAVLQVLLDPVPMDARDSMRNVPAVGLVLGALALVAILSGWTWLGLRVAKYLLRSVIGEDQLEMDSKGVTWRRWWRLGSPVHYLPYSDVAAFPAQLLSEVTALLKSGGTVTLATLGTMAEHEALWKRLCALSKRGAVPESLSACVPEGYESAPLPGGAVMLRRMRDGGRGHIWVLCGAALLFVASAVAITWRQGIDGMSVEGPSLAVVLVGLAGLAGFLAWPPVHSRLEWEVRPGVLDSVWYEMGRPKRTSHRAESLEARRDEFEEIGERPAGVSFSLWLHTPTGAVSLTRDKVYPESVDHLGHWLGHRLRGPMDRSAIEKALEKREPAPQHHVG
ncbi:hypothetical protein ACLEPN_03250 [Myxococcus sp. 1LA]